MSEKPTIPVHAWGGLTRAYDTASGSDEDHPIFIMPVLTEIRDKDSTRFNQGMIISVNLEATNPAISEAITSLLLLIELIENAET